MRVVNQNSDFRGRDRRKDKPVENFIVVCDAAAGNRLPTGAVPILDIEVCNWVNAGNRRVNRINRIPVIIRDAVNRYFIDCSARVKINFKPIRVNAETGILPRAAGCPIANSVNGDARR